MKNRKLSKSISDASWTQFLEWVERYGMLYKRPVIAVPPQYTSQDCSSCGTRVKKTLSVRTHVCPKCNLVIDRDENAALNILVKGLNQAGIALKTYPGAQENEYAWGQTNLCLVGGNLQSGVDWMNQESPDLKSGECQKPFLSKKFNVLAS